MKIQSLSFCLCLLMGLTGCTSYSHEQDYNDRQAYDQDVERDDVQLTDEDRASGITLEDKRAAIEATNVQKKQLQNAYERGVRDTMEDFKGRMRGSKAFVYEPPVIEYVEMPATVVNGVLRPARVEPVIVTPGRWIEKNGINLPE